MDHPFERLCMFSFTRRPPVDPFDALLAASAARDAVEVVKQADALIASRTVGVDGFYNWALVHLDAWGLAKCLETEFPGGSTLLRFFAVLSDPIGLENHEEHLRLKNEAWPVIWAAAQANGTQLRRLLSEVYLAHHNEAPIDLSLLDLPEGPFSEGFHSYKLVWKPRRQIWVDEFTPLQIAWASQDVALLGLLLKHGAGLDQSFPETAWPKWTLRLVLESPDAATGLKRAGVDGHGVRELLRKALEAYGSSPEARLQLSQTVRMGVLDRQLPSPQHRRQAPRF